MSFAAVHYDASVFPRMNRQEKKRLQQVLRATEYLFVENLALKLVLEHRGVKDWQRLADRLIADKEILAGVRLKFSDIYRQIERSDNPSAVLENWLREIPAAKKAALTYTIRGFQTLFLSLLHNRQNPDRASRSALKLHRRNHDQCAHCRNAL